MNESNPDAPSLVRRRRRIARQQREKTPEPVAKTGIKPKFSDDESSSTTTTPNEFEKRRTSSTSAQNNSRLKAKTASNSSGAGSGNSSNVAYREKILNRRDRAARPASLVRSHSTPRELQDLQAELSPAEEQKPSDTSGNLIRYLRKAKRSLSIPR